MQEEKGLDFDFKLVSAIHTFEGPGGADTVNAKLFPQLLTIY